VRRGAAARWIAARWLGAWLAGTGLLVALPFAAPALAAAGQARAAGAIYAAMRPMCHQLPHHSWFLGGAQAAWSRADVAAVLGPSDSPAAWIHRPVAGGPLGYQLAVCQRDLATYVGLLLTSLVFALRAPARRPGIGWRGYALGLVPIAADGVTQLVGLRESTPMLRALTGGLFGVATALFVLPQLDAVARDARRPPARAPRGVEEPGGAPDQRE